MYFLALQIEWLQFNFCPKKRGDPHPHLALILPSGRRRAAQGLAQDRAGSTAQARAAVNGGLREEGREHFEHVHNTEGDGSSSGSSSSEQDSCDSLSD